MPSAADGRMAPPFLGQPAGITRQTPTAAAQTVEPAMPWEEEGEEEGTVEAVFEADVSETEAVLAALSQAAQKAEEFPMDAFIIPEHAQRVPTGLEGKPKSEAPAHTPLTDLADRLEKLSHRMRVENADEVISRLAAGDKLDALLAGLLAGFLAGSK
ncbi:MAG: hypothetical protein ACT4O1_14095 [Gemmatimonadota bacterium]